MEDPVASAGSRALMEPANPDSAKKPRDKDIGDQDDSNHQVDSWSRAESDCLLPPALPSPLPEINLFLSLQYQASLQATGQVQPSSSNMFDPASFKAFQQAAAANAQAADQQSHNIQCQTASSGEPLPIIGQGFDLQAFAAGRGSFLTSTPAFHHLSEHPPVTASSGALPIYPSARSGSGPTQRFHPYPMRTPVAAGNDSGADEPSTSSITASAQFPGGKLSASATAASRAVYNKFQRELLNAVFQHVPYPTRAQRDLMAESLGGNISQQQIKVWFQNARRRAVMKGKGQQSFQESGDNSSVAELLTEDEPVTPLPSGVREDENKLISRIARQVVLIGERHKAADLCTAASNANQRLSSTMVSSRASSRRASTVTTSVASPDPNSDSGYPASVLSAESFVSSAPSAVDLTSSTTAPTWPPNMPSCAANFTPGSASMGQQQSWPMTSNSGSTPLFATSTPGTNFLPQAGGIQQPPPVPSSIYNMIYQRLLQNQQLNQPVSGNFPVPGSFPSYEQQQLAPPHCTYQQQRLFPEQPRSCAVNLAASHPVFGEANQAYCEAAPYFPIPTNNMAMHPPAPLFASPNYYQNLSSVRPSFQPGPPQPTWPLSQMPSVSQPADFQQAAATAYLQQFLTQQSQAAFAAAAAASTPQSEPQRVSTTPEQTQSEQSESTPDEDEDLDDEEDTQSSSGQ